MQAGGREGVGDNYNEKAMSLVFSQQFYFTNVYNICKIKLSD